MLTPMFLIRKPQFQLFYCCHIISIHRTFSCLNREREYQRVIRPHNIIFNREAQVDHKLRKRIFLIRSYSPDIVGIMSSVNTRCSINELADCSRRFNTRYSSRLWDTHLLRPFCISCYCYVAQLF